MGVTVETRIKVTQVCFIPYPLNIKIYWQNIIKTPWGTFEDFYDSVPFYGLYLKKKLQQTANVLSNNKVYTGTTAKPQLQMWDKTFWTDIVAFFSKVEMSPALLKSKTIYIWMQST